MRCEQSPKELTGGKANDGQWQSLSRNRRTETSKERNYAPRLANSWLCHWGYIYHTTNISGLGYPHRKFLPGVVYTCLHQSPTERILAPLTSQPAFNHVAGRTPENGAHIASTHIPDHKQATKRVLTINEPRVWFFDTANLCMDNNHFLSLSLHTTLFFQKKVHP